MIEADAIKFYQAIIRLKPEMVDFEQKELFKRLGDCMEIIHGITPTRDHMKIALAKFKHGLVGRSWTLKFRYGVNMFLKDITMRPEVVHASLKSIFNQRTRPGVIQSMCDEAKILITEKPPEELAEFRKAVDMEIMAKSKDTSFFN